MDHCSPRGPPLHFLGELPFGLPTPVSTGSGSKGRFTVARAFLYHYQPLSPLGGTPLTRSHHGGAEDVCQLDDGNVLDALLKGQRNKHADLLGSEGQIDAERRVLVTKWHQTAQRIHIFPCDDANISQPQIVENFAHKPSQHGGQSQCQSMRKGKHDDRHAPRPSLR